MVSQMRLQYRCSRELSTVMDQEMRIARKWIWPELEARNQWHMPHTEGIIVLGKISYVDAAMRKTLARACLVGQNRKAFIFTLPILQRVPFSSLKNPVSFARRECCLSKHPLRDCLRDTLDISVYLGISMGSGRIRGTWVLRNELVGRT
jgi:hypothetical protein